MKPLLSGLFYGLSVAGGLALFSGCSGNATNPVGGGLLDRNAGRVVEIVKMPPTSARNLFERIETLKPPVTTLRVGLMRDLQFRSLLRFRVPIDSLAAARGVSATDIRVDSLGVVIRWRPASDAYLFHAPGEGPFAVRLPVTSWNDSMAFFDSTSSAETPFISSAVPGGVEVERTDSTAVLRFSSSALEASGEPGVLALNILLEPDGPGEFMMAAFSTDASDPSAGVRRPRIFVGYQAGGATFEYSSPASEDVSWGARFGSGPPEDRLLLTTGIRISPLLRFAIPDSVPEDITVNLARLEFQVPMATSLFDLLAMQMDVLSMTTQGDTTYTSFHNTLFSTLAFREPRVNVSIDIGENVVRNWAAGTLENLGIAIRSQSDPYVNWMVIENPTLTIVYSLAPEVP